MEKCKLDKELNVLGFTKSADALLRIYYNNLDTRKNFGSAISKSINTTYSHTVKILKKFEDLQLIIVSKEGRVKKIYLTDKGKGIAKRLAEIKNLLNK